ncbi:MAG TPA: hypothetical protein VFG59_06755 [Anaeromyxobacter sp.]|nr:hypothetical protein [Anaeromyxobacter sp.]
MSRPFRVRALVLVALLAAAGCQDYNFNPVGHCLIQPGSERVKLSAVTTADVLFVIDDSGSMGGVQQKLASNFDTFITNLDNTNQTRVQQQQTPIDFHLAVTTTSIFYNAPAQATCTAAGACPGATSAGSVCCTVNASTAVAPMKVVQTGCEKDSDCVAGTCRTDCTEYLGENACCDPTSKVPQQTQEVPCQTVGAPCGDLQTHYRWTAGDSCSPGDAVNGMPYPHGAFVGAAGNPLVIHFDKSLYPAAPGGPTPTNGQGFTASQLMTFFKQNVAAGTCGSGEEQALQAGKLAVVKALANGQRDTYDLAGQAVDSPAIWPHPDSKLVAVFIGDEDDCSSPEDASAGIVLTGNPGSDACVADQALPPDQQKEFSVTSLVNYFTGLDRPLGAAFIVSARAGDQDVCQDETCTPAICCDTACTGNPNVCNSQTCGGKAPGTRLLAAADQLRGAAADVVAGSICDPNFAAILDRIAEIVKPPTGLLLPSQPADDKVSVLRIAGADGKTRKTCNGPAPSSLTAAQAADTGPDKCAQCPYDWWFTASREQLTPDEQQPTGASRYVYINHDTMNCEANPGESYSMDYLGRLPASGCTGATAEDADAACVATLGGRAGDWTCFAGVDDSNACILPVGGVVGTCVCGPRYLAASGGGTASGTCKDGCTPASDTCPAPTP